jgi:hypothetical protein
MKNTFVLTEASEDDYARCEWQNNGIPSNAIFKKTNKFFRAIRRIWVKCSLPLEYIWYADWKEAVKNADMIIVHMTYLTLNLCSYLNKINPEAKVIAWYWNKVDKNYQPSLVKGNCEFWSFDKENCKKYHMNFNHQYYFKSFVSKETVEPEWDVYFCGSDSGRGKEISDAYRIFQDLNLTTKFQVVYPQYKNLPEEIISPAVSYEKVRDNIAKTKCILEIVRDGQSGPTLRVMEALYFGKKLITNNRYVKSEEFYDPNAVFILGERNLNELEAFVKGSQVHYDAKLLDQYDVSRWIENFYRQAKGEGNGNTTLVDANGNWLDMEKK